MPVYNTSVPFLKEAVNSILEQSFGEFEFIIIDDGSAVPARDYLDSQADPRIRIIRNEKNLGITKSLNTGFRAAKGKYIARMDSDDISLPGRLQKQYTFMESHPDVIICGVETEALGSAERKRQSLSGKYKIEDREEYRIKMLFVNPGPFHPTAFFRHEKLIEHGILYDERLYYAQDYGMWETISHYGNVAVLEDVLFLRRKHENQISTAHRERQIQCDKMTQRKLLSDLLGSVTEEEMDLHYIHSTGFFRDAKITPEAVRWYDRILKANDRRRIYNRRKLKKRILMIERRLVEQSFTREMSKLEKLRLVFKYLPFLYAVRETKEIVLLKFNSFISS